MCVSVCVCVRERVFPCGDRILNSALLPQHHPNVAPHVRYLRSRVQELEAAFETSHEMQV